ncbi:slipin family protein [Candidatus Halobeggiatoa sp. HSG11]|nr:slipin family protein [Candidatus Halobeggiatoa sp. HSG11]
MTQFIIGIAVLILIILFYSFTILREYERAVVFFLGRYRKVKGPGPTFIFPLVETMIKMDTRTVVMDVPSQDVISKDNVSVKVNAVVYFRTIHPEKAVIQVADYQQATSQLAQTTLRSVLGHHELDDILTERDKLNKDIQEILDEQTDAWGIKVSNVEIKHVDLNESMIRAIARQAEAERERRAKVIHADGELQASEKLQQAAKIISTQPQALQLRYLQTMNDVASESKTNTIVFPLPIDLIGPLQDLLKKAS